MTRRILLLMASLAGLTAHAQTEGLRSVPSPALTIRIPLGEPLDLRAIPTRAALEMGAVALTGVGHLAAASQDASAVYIPVVIAGWGGYLGYRVATEPGYLAEAGFTHANAGRAWRDASLVGLGATSLMAVVGASRGTLDTDGLLLPMLVLYPAWGLTQQFLVQSLVTRNLAAIGVSKAAIPPISALAFGAVHAPNWDLTAMTTVAGAAFTALYQRDGTLWPLGVTHGVLGAFAYVWVLDRQSWDEVLNGPPTP